MNESKHTAGPWFAQANWEIQSAVQTEIPVIVAKTIAVADLHEREANAELIASAPSLLAENAWLREALKRLLSAYEADVRAGIGIAQSWETNGQAIDQALTALAEGGGR